MQPIWVALITIVGGAGSGFGGALLKKWLDAPRERSDLEDLVVNRLKSELTRVDERITELTTELKTTRADLKSTLQRLEVAERSADVDRHNQDLLILHIGVLEGLVPPPPPPRPTLLKVEDLS